VNRDEPGQAGPVAALVGRPAVLVRHEVMESLHAAGFHDVLPGHLAVFAYPGPEGQRPGLLASRSHASKQAMNHVLHQLESGGYLTREPSSGDQRTRVVRLTERGRDVDAVIARTVTRLDERWRQALGEELYGRLAEGLDRLHRLLDSQMSSS
jgi:DNA-binding MarR family transcriptional regulator